MCESENINHIVLPPAEAVEIIAQAAKIYVRDCPCRVREQVCPRDTWEVCLLFEHASEDELQDARPITTDEALAVLKTSAERGLVHRLFYKSPSLQLTEVCNCCDCCCGPHLELKQKGNYGEQLRSGYVAVTDEALCVDCGLCQESCFFDARWLEDGKFHFADERCFGCGQCINACPEEAIGLELQTGRGVSIPDWRGLN